MAAKGKAGGLGATFFPWSMNFHEITTCHQGRLATPSSVSFTEIGGDSQLNQVASNPTHNLCGGDMKRRLTGQSCFHDFCVPFEIKCGSDEDPIISVWDNGEEMQYTPKQISVMVLGMLSQMAHDAPLELCHRMLVHRNEPVAAAIAYCFAKKASIVDGMNILVFGLGGSTVNAALLAMEDGIFKVKATDGDTLGGNDFVHRMVGHLVKEFEVMNNKDFSGHPTAYRRLWACCEDAVKILSSACVTTIEVKCLFEGIDFCYRITRDKFEELNMDLFRKCLVPVEKCLKQAGMASSSVQTVVLGCSTKIPRVQNLLQNMFSSKQLVTFINHDQSFAHSADVLSAIISKDLNALGIPQFDVMPHSLGLETVAGVVVLIPKNAPIPIRKDRLFTTVSDNQSSVLIRVCHVISECQVGGPASRFLTEFILLSNITPAPKGVTTIKVCFAIDNKGVLEVTAEDVTNQNCICSYACSLKVERLLAHSSDN